MKKMNQFRNMEEEFEKPLNSIKLFPKMIEGILAMTCLVVRVFSIVLNYDEYIYLEKKPKK